MLRRNTLLRAGEFSTKSHSERRPPVMKYGRGYLCWKATGSMWKRPIRFRTTDSNKLVNFAARYQHIIDGLDNEKNEQDKGVKLEDVRWNDHRMLHFKCPDCKFEYEKYVSVHAKYRIGCPKCKFIHPCVQCDPRHIEWGESVTQRYPKLFEESAEANPRVLEKCSPYARFGASWKCKECGDTYLATVRNKTGAHETGYMNLDPGWKEYCPSCVWKKRYFPTGEQILKNAAAAASNTTAAATAGSSGKGKAPGGKKKEQQVASSSSGAASAFAGYSWLGIDGDEATTPFQPIPCTPNMLASASENAAKFPVRERVKKAVKSPSAKA